MKTKKLIDYLDEYLETDKIPDSSLNGLQVEGKAEIKKIGVSVDACLDSIEAAAAAKVDMLIVHHGLFWGKPEPLTGSNYRRIKALIKGGINLYCSHLPLDWHPEVGNNAVLARKIGFEPIAGFGPSGAADGRSIGCVAISGDDVTQAEFMTTISTELSDEIRADFFGPKTIKRIAVITGGGASFIPLAHAANVDAYITGEPKHSYYHFCKENKLNVIYGGHYNTEVFGVIALGEHLKEKYKIPYQFFHFPTGY